MVAFFKVLLPLAALAILATLFLLSRSDEQIATVPFAKDDVAARTKNQQITRPFFSGTTNKGEEIIVQADSASPGTDAKPGHAENLDARLKLVGGQEITLKSDSGTLSVGGDFVTFLGNVRIKSATGMEMITEQLNTALSGIQGHAPGVVRGNGDMGTLTAGSMEFSAKTGDGDVHMLFKNGVKLVYDPKQPER